MEIPVGYLKRKISRWTSGILRECVKTDRLLLWGNDSALCGLGVAEFLDISESMSPTKSSIVPLARFKRLTIDLLYRNSLELATFRAEKHIKLGFCNPPVVLSESSCDAGYGWMPPAP